MILTDEASWAQTSTLADWQEGKITKEFYEKTARRAFSAADAERTLKSRSSGVWRYRDHGQPRYGFWHPETWLLVAWQPAAEGLHSEVKTAFIVREISVYMADRDSVTLLRAPRGEPL